MAKECKVHTITATFHPEEGGSLAEQLAQFLNEKALHPGEVITIPQDFTGDTATRLDVVYFDDPEATAQRLQQKKSH